MTETILDTAVKMQGIHRQRKIADANKLYGALEEDRQEAMVESRILEKLGVLSRIPRRES